MINVVAEKVQRLPKYVKLEKMCHHLKKSVMYSKIL